LSGSRMRRRRVQMDHQSWVLGRITTGTAGKSRHS
jgi:hypothetical protein